MPFSIFIMYFQFHYQSPVERGGGLFIIDLLYPVLLNENNFKRNVQREEIRL